MERKLDKLGKFLHINSDNDDEYRALLKDFQPDDLTTIDEHIEFLEYVARHSDYLIHIAKQFGTHYFDELKKRFGINSLNDPSDFIHELIQNSDDAFREYTFDGVSKPFLKIRFNYGDDVESDASIVLEYNELGFTPANVFAIASLADSTKGVNDENRSIGQKGIGFKSVFGIADKVLIQSNMFSFSISREDFFKPVPEYDNDYSNHLFKGTRLTIFLKSGKCKELYDNYVVRFQNNCCILENNVILFLNYLNYLKLESKDSSLEFNVERKTPTQLSENLSVEDGVRCSIVYKNKTNPNENYVHSNTCIRFCRKLHYSYELCRERYPDFKSRGIKNAEEHQKAGLPTEELKTDELEGIEEPLFAVFPYPEDVLNAKNDLHGSLYTNLPTRIKTTIPVAIHASYELDSSREYPVNNHPGWFDNTNEGVIALLCDAFKHLAKCFKEQAAYYFPKIGQCVFLNDGSNAILSVFEKYNSGFSSFKGDFFCSKPIFYTNNGLKTVSEIAYFRPAISRREEVCNWLSLNSQYDVFLEPSGISMGDFGCKQAIERVPNMLMAKALENSDVFPQILDWLIEQHNCVPDYGGDKFYDSLFGDLTKELSRFKGPMVASIISHPELANEVVFQRIAYCYSIHNSELFKDVLEWLSRATSVDYDKLYRDCEDVKCLTEKQIDGLLDCPDLAEKQSLQYLMFESGFVHIKYFDQIFDWLCGGKANVGYFLKTTSAKKLNADLIEHLYKFEDYRTAIKELNQGYLCNKMAQPLELPDRQPFEKVPSDKIEKLKKVSKVGLDQHAVLYLNRIKDNIYVISPELCGDNQDVCIFTGQGILLSKDGAFQSLAHMLKVCDFESKDSFFCARLGVSEIQDEINRCDPNASESNYLERLTSLKQLEKEFMTGSIYDSFLSSIKQSVSDKKQFISELIQNADDLEYSPGVEPSFEIKVDKDKIITVSNETGFLNKNIRAILDIGRSTKKMLGLVDDNPLIGEKGFGFKTVFNFADRVEIHSNVFHFSLNSESPTVPIVIRNVKDDFETRMFLHLSGNDEEKSSKCKELQDYFSIDDNLLNLCVCLRRLKLITLGGRTIRINDSNLNDSNPLREITIDDGEPIRLLRHDYPISITNKEALRSRFNKGEGYLGNSRITIYAPEDEKAESAFKTYRLHTGLPINEESRVHMIFDIPFELATSRETYIKYNAWNNEVRTTLYDAFSDCLKSMRRTGLRILRFIPTDWQIFKDDYLNDLSDNKNVLKQSPEEIKDSCKSLLTSKLQNIKFVPILQNEYVPLHGGNPVSRLAHSHDGGTAPQTRLLLKPDGCVLLDPLLISTHHIDIDQFFDNIVDLNGAPENSDEILEQLGCKWASFDEIFNCLKEVVNGNLLNEDDKFRDELYSYVNSRDVEEKKRLLETLPLLPSVVGEGRNEYVVFSDDLYYLPTNSSLKAPIEGYCIINRSIFSKYDLLKDVGDLHELTPEQIEADYGKRLDEQLDNSCDHPEDIAAWLLNEYDSITKSGNTVRRKTFCDVLKRRLDDVPTLRSDYEGSYLLGRAFIPSQGCDSLEGEALKKLIVDSEYAQFAEAIGFESISKLNTYLGQIGTEFLGEQLLDIPDLIDLTSDLLVDQSEVISFFVNRGKVQLLVDLSKDYYDSKADEDLAVSLNGYLNRYGKDAIDRILKICGVRKSLIPCKRKDGKFRSGSKFIIEGGQVLRGDLLRSFIVDNDYRDLANVIGCYKISDLKWEYVRESLKDSIITNDDLIDLYTHCPKNADDFIKKAKEEGIIKILKDIQDGVNLELIASQFLNAFKEGSKELQVALKQVASGNESDIPCHMANGDYCLGDKFETCDKQFVGELLPSMVLNADSKCLNGIVTKGTIVDITYSDILEKTESITNADFLDLCDFNLKNEHEIISSAISGEGGLRLGILDFIDNSSEEEVAEYFNSVVGDSKTDTAKVFSRLLKECDNLKEKIPLKMMDGTYSFGSSRYLNEGYGPFEGTYLKHILVDDEYNKLASRIGVKSIKGRVSQKGTYEYKDDEESIVSLSNSDLEDIYNILKAIKETDKFDPLVHEFNESDKVVVSFISTICNKKDESGADYLLEEWKQHPVICEILIREMVSTNVDDLRDLPLYNDDGGLCGAVRFTNINGKKLVGNLLNSHLIGPQYMGNGLANVLNDLKDRNKHRLYRDLTDISYNDLKDVESVSFNDVRDLYNCVKKDKFESIIKEIIENHKSIVPLFYANGSFIELPVEEVTEVGKSIHDCYNDDSDVFGALLRLLPTDWSKSVPLRDLTGQYTVVPKYLYKNYECRGNLFKKYGIHGDDVEFAKVLGYKEKSVINLQIKGMPEIVSYLDLEDDNIILASEQGKTASSDNGLKTFIDGCLEAHAFEDINALDNTDNLDECAEIFLSRYPVEGFRLLIDYLKSNRPELIDKIPCVAESGRIIVGRKYLNEKNKHVFKGELMGNLVVSDEYVNIARLMKCRDISLVNSGDFEFLKDYDMEITENDLDDLQRICKKNYSNILGYLCAEGYINTDDPRFEWLVDEGNVSIATDQFKHVPVDIEAIKKELDSEIPNPYVEKTVVVRQPNAEIDEYGYLESQYVNENKKWECQMCRCFRTKRYIESTTFEASPEFARKQMYLSLCVACSRWYRNAISNEGVWSNFLKDIKHNTSDGDRSITIPIGDQEKIKKSVTFTACHFETVKEILSRYSKDYQSIEE